MPKISYQEIVSADISESGAVLHEWEMEGEGKFVCLYHSIDGRIVKTFRYGDAIREWNKLCQSK